MGTSSFPLGTKSCPQYLETVKNMQGFYVSGLCYEDLIELKEDFIASILAASTTVHL